MPSGNAGASFLGHPQSSGCPSGQLDSSSLQRGLACHKAYSPTNNPEGPKDVLSGEEPRTLTTARSPPTRRGQPKDHRLILLCLPLPPAMDTGSPSEPTGCPVTWKTWQRRHTGLTLPHPHRPHLTGTSILTGDAASTPGPHQGPALPPGSWQDTSPELACSCFLGDPALCVFKAGIKNCRMGAIRGMMLRVN